MDILGWLSGQFIMWLIPGLLLTFGVAFIVEIASKIENPQLSKREERRLKKSNSLYQNIVHRYREERIEHPLTLEVPSQCRLEHEDWIRDRVFYFESEFGVRFNYSKDLKHLRAAQKREKIFTTPEVYIDACKFIDKEPHDDILTVWSINNNDIVEERYD